jgi:hypothetical protein
MSRITCGCLLSFLLGCSAYGYEDPEVLLNRFLERIKSELRKQPDFTCAQSTERFRRASSERAWEKMDVLRLEVALVGDREMYAPAGARQFQSRALVEMVGKGTISTGQFANLARHVFLSSTARFSFRTQSEEDGRHVYQYEYDVDPAHSSYHLRSGTSEAVVGFQGAFWVDADNVDLLRLEVQAYDIPEKLGLAEAGTSVAYSRSEIDSIQALLPASAEFHVVAVNAEENLNRSRFSSCRHYSADSTVRYETASLEGEADRAAPPHESAATAVPAGAVLDLMLDSAVDGDKASVGDAVRARLARPLRDGEKIIAPQGASVVGRLLRLEKRSLPFPLYDIALELTGLELDGRTVPLAATMQGAGPAAGLIRQAKRMDPTFTRHRTARMDILVHEIQHGQGILVWDARRGPVPRGLRMTWRIDQGAASLPTSLNSK